ncbi:SDR family NAD(P)-dependent oxidoreductase [Methylocystis sp. WRRC1]|uniref:SDR family NAD(P)-dependent oxidoreductase n=1 Tax=Methylocystis sp. WRRC1 TaxID=1732014 RepID=UPI001D14C374|nr:SDR family NAD(P)-dependent oxidoreductase [Methylocystis sp. WRRC1]MCC3247348.1 SDR family NAD(P)-dependent oxidoreductase [Methylocystis sp. WRRC1]
MDIRGKIVLVTGASSGVGAAVARAMAAAGAGQIVLVARNEAALRKVADIIAADGGRADVYAVDLSDPDRTTEVARRILEEIGAPDILVNNAGAGQWKFLDESTPQEIQSAITVPYLAAAWVTRAFLPAMRQRGSGHIVNVSSAASRIVWPGATAYTAARWAMRGLTEALRADLHGSGITVSLFEGGAIDSPYWAHNPGSRERLPGISKLIPLLTPEDAGAAIVAGVRADKGLIVAPFLLKVIYALHYVFPWAAQGLLTRSGYRRPDGA